MVVILVLKEYQTGQDESWLPGAASGLGARPELRGKGVPAVPGATAAVCGQDSTPGREPGLFWAGLSAWHGSDTAQPSCCVGWWLPCLE